MKKILILSYFYYPANFVGSERIASWAKYLKVYGYYPIIITRQWNENQKDLVERVLDNELTIEQNEFHEAHRLPYKRSFRDIIADYPKLKILQKLLTLKEIILSHFFIRSLPFSNFYEYSCNYIEKNPDVKTVLISARPFHAFFIGYKLKNQFPKINWIADYRDDWTTGITYIPEGILNTLIHFMDKRFEKKWLSNVHSFISTSKNMVDAISASIQKKGFVVLNGFEEIEMRKAPFEKLQEEQFRILYSGTLYNNQRIEILLKAISRIKEKIEVCFIGSDSIPAEWNRLKQLSKTYPFIRLIPRQPKEQLLKHMADADIFFASAYDNMKGFIPVKCFDYLLWETPVILCPSDKDALKDFIHATSCGEVAENEQECFDLLSKWIKQKNETGMLHLPRNKKEKEKYTRKYQVKKLAEILNSIT